MSILDFILKNQDMIVSYMINHLTLVAEALAISLVIWIPVGFLITKNEKLESIVMGISSMIFCIPSLALYVVLITVPFLGLGRKSALLALVLYAMMPLIRSVGSGIKSINNSVIEAAKGMGMDQRRIFFDVQIPLASPVIFSGIRNVTVIITSTAALATYIGEKNLGRLISQGLSRSNIEMIVVGAIMISLTALILDGALAIVERKLSYKN